MTTTPHPTPRTGRSAVVSGASIAGLATAWWLHRTGWAVTVLERAPQFRDGGQNVDVRGTAREVVERMGLLEAVRGANTTETGTVVVDADGGVVAELPSDGPDGATAELEVLRGDLARLLLDHLPDGVELVLDDTVDDVQQRPGGVTVTTAAGRRLEADLLVVAEGVRSATRDRVFGEEVSTNELGITMAFGTIPRTPDDDTRWRWFNALGGRQVHLRPDPHGTTRAMLVEARGEDLTGEPHDVVVAGLRERFADAGWQAPRVLDGFAGSDDVYVDQLAQVTMGTWRRGRVVLVGDAAWCVTPMGGGGSSLALIGAHVLAAHLSTEPDVDAALAAFEAWMRPLVEDAQQLPPAIELLAYPRTRVGLGLRNLALKALTSPPLKPLVARMSQVADAGRELPELRAGVPR